MWLRSGWTCGLLHSGLDDIQRVPGNESAVVPAKDGVTDGPYMIRIYMRQMYQHCKSHASSGELRALTSDTPATAPIHDQHVFTW